MSEKRLTPKEALDRLVEGNERYISGTFLHPNRTKESRDAVVDQQKPFAIILGCSDSRVSPEIVFDQGIGDLFVVRVAGNVVGPLELDSINFSALHLNSCLVFVLGHENCGAISAVVENRAEDIKAVATLIEPVVESSRGKAGDLIHNAMKANIRQVVKKLKTTPSIARLIQEEKLDVVGGYYCLTSGKVDIFD